jgi:hypothetical protein
MPFLNQRLIEWIPHFLYSGGIHAIAGQSGTGKTIWTWQLLECLLERKLPPGLENLTLGEPLKNNQWAFITADRLSTAMQRLHAEINCKLDPANMYSWADDKSLGYDQVSLIKFIRSHVPTNGIAVIDCAPLLMGKLNPNSQNDVRTFLSTLQRELCLGYNITVLTLGYVTKQKESERYAGRDRLSGSMAWQGMCDSLIIFERDLRQEFADDYVQVDFYFRHGMAAKHVYLTWNDNHRLVSCARPEKVITADQMTAKMLIRDYADKLAIEGKEFTREILRGNAPEALTDSSKERIISDVLREMREDGVIRLAGRGKYIRIEAA